MAVSRKNRVARWAGAGLLALAPVPWLGFGTASAAVYAQVDGHAAFSAAANKASYWGDGCRKIEGGNLGTAYVLTQDYALVVVKAGSGQYANTLFEDANAGETVWADTNGDGMFNPGGKNGDKGISHIIVCEGEDEPSPSPSETKSTSSPSPSNTESSESPSPSESESTGSESPPPSSDSPSSSPSTSAPTSESGSPPGSAGPTDESKHPTEVQSSESAKPAAATLPRTGGGMPVAGAVGVSLLLIGIGALLLLGPGRLIPAWYIRKH